MLESLANNPGLMILLLLLGTTLVSGATLWRIRGEWAMFQAWRNAGMPAPSITDAPSGAAPAVARLAAALDATPLPGAGRALKNPPADLRVIVDYISQYRPGEPYTIPLGWQHLSTGAPELVTAQLVGDVNHILISGQSNAGKDNAVMGMCLALASQHSPQQVQFCFVDGKGLDWGGVGEQSTYMAAGY